MNGHAPERLLHDAGCNDYSRGNQRVRFRTKSDLEQHSYYRKRLLFLPTLTVTWDNQGGSMYSNVLNYTSSIIKQYGSTVKVGIAPKMTRVPKIAA